MMNELKILINKDINQIKNYFREFKENKKKMLPILFYILWFIFMLNSQSETNYYSINYFKNLSFAILSVLLIISITNVYFERTSYFNMADVNFLFTAPISPKTILLYSIFKTSWKQLLAALFMFIFLSPSLISSGILFPEILLGVMGYALFIFSLEPICFIASKLGKKYNLKAIILILLLFLILPITIPMIIEKSIIKGIQSDLMNFIPLIGWSRGIFMSMFKISSNLFIFIFLQLSFILIINLYILKTASNYFEDMLSSTENKSKYIENKKRGKSKFKLKINFNKNKKISLKKNYYGSKAFHFKNKLISYRNDFHYLFGIETLGFFILGIGAIIIRNIKFYDYSLITFFTYLTIIILYIYTLFSINTNGQEELDMPFFYLIPDSNIKKIISVNQLPVERMILNSLILFIVPSIVDFKNILAYFLMFIMFNSIYIVIKFSNILIRSIFRKEVDFTLMLPIIKIFQLFLIAIPSLIGVIIASLVNNIINFDLQIIIFISIFLSNISILLIQLLLMDLIISRIEI